jgi:hypothetical protein
MDDQPFIRHDGRRADSAARSSWPAAAAGWYSNPGGTATRYPPPPHRGRKTTTDVLALTADQRLRLTAIHEAGHAVLWHLAGVRLDKVLVRTVAEAAQLGVREAGQTIVAAAATLPLVDGLAVAAAGERAEDRWLREAGLWTEERAWVIERHAAHDRSHARDAVQGAGSMLTFGQRPGHPYDYVTVQADADRRLSAVWDGVQRLADALVTHREVDGSAVAAIVHARPEGEPWWHAVAPPAAALAVFAVEGLLLPGRFIAVLDLGVYLGSAAAVWGGTRRLLRRLPPRG